MLHIILIFQLNMVPVFFWTPLVPGIIVLELFRWRFLKAVVTRRCDSLFWIWTIPHIDFNLTSWVTQLCCLLLALITLRSLTPTPSRNGLPSYTPLVCEWSTSLPACQVTSDVRELLPPIFRSLNFSNFWPFFLFLTWKVHALFEQVLWYWCSSEPHKYL